MITRQQFAGALAGAALAGGAVVGGVMQLTGSSGSPADCATARWDVNCDARVNSLDLLVVAKHFGEVYDTATEVPTSQPSITATASLPTSTPSPSPVSTLPPTATQTLTSTPSPLAPSPTFTASPTSPPTSTPTPTAIFRSPTPTPAAGALTIAQVINDLTAPHEGTICGVGGFDWQFHAANQGGVPGGGFTVGTGWGVYNWNCGSNKAGVVAEMRTGSLWAGVWTGSAWKQTTDHVSWCETMRPQTDSFDGPGCGGLGPAWNMPSGAYSLHWASDHRDVSGAHCAFTRYQARVSGSGATGSWLMADAGFDYWKPDNSAIDASFVGRYRRLTTDWQWITGSSCDATTLTAHPPPLQ